MDERQFSVLGGDAESITGRLRELDHEGMSLGAAIGAATSALSGPDRTLKAEDLEVAVLARSNGRRCFRRLADDEVAALLAG
jgi:proteasome alpha subunit